MSLCISLFTHTHLWGFRSGLRQPCVCALGAPNVHVGCASHKLPQLMIDLALHLFQCQSWGWKVFQSSRAHFLRQLPLRAKNSIIFQLSVGGFVWVAFGIEFRGIQCPWNGMLVLLEGVCCFHVVLSPNQQPLPGGCACPHSASLSVPQHLGQGGQMQKGFI